MHYRCEIVLQHLDQYPLSPILCTSLLVEAGCQIVMSAIDQLPSFGRSIFVALLPTIKAYGELHEKNRTAIESTPREEFEYGPHDRQKLDLYTPENMSDDTPILVFVYGGGFSRGDKRAASLPGGPTSLVYHNLGHYWTVSGTNRRLPGGADFHYQPVSRLHNGNSGLPKNWRRRALPIWRRRHGRRSGVDQEQVQRR